MNNPIKKVGLDQLKPHPLQSQAYTRCSQSDDDVLAEDLRVNGQRDPIVVMPDKNKAGLPGGTILDGHRRAQVMLANGQTEADVLFRDDLKDADEQQVTVKFLRLNLLRRQLHPLDKARLVQQMFLTKVGRSLNDLDVWKRGELRDHVGKSLEMSGRNLDRYLRVLETPIEIQVAVRDKRLKLVLASQIALLPEGEQHEIAQRIAGLTDRGQVKAIVEEFIEISESTQQRVSGAGMATLMQRLGSTLRALDERTTDVSPLCYQNYLEKMKEEAERLNAIICRAEGPQDEP